MAAAGWELLNDVPEVILEEILLRLPSSASLVRAAHVSKQWGRIISSAGFLGRYRKLHPSSPLLGFHFSDRDFGLPAVRLNALVRDDHDLKAVERVADLNLVDLERDPGWRIRDSRNGHLLLCRQTSSESGGDSFSIYNPVSRRLVTIPADRPHHHVDYFADCLLLGDHDDDSSRVVSVQQHGGKIRAVEYDPGARQWRSPDHPPESPWPLGGRKYLNRLEAMYAGDGLIFWRYTAASALVLNCSTMRFSMCTNPVTEAFYAIGEIEDGVGCFACIHYPGNTKTHGVLKVWLLKKTNTRDITWEFSGKQITVRELLGADARVLSVEQVTNGLALLSFSDKYDQFVVDLNKLTLHSEFDFHGRPYAYQMTWPPIWLAALQEICNEEAQPEAQPVQLVLPVEPAPLPHDVDVAAPIEDVDLAAPLHDIDVPAPIDDVGLAAPHQDVDVAAQIDDVAYTEGPLAVVLRRLDLCGTEHVINTEANNSVRPVEDGVRLMETKASETAAPSADLLGGMTHSSETIYRKQRCEGDISSFRVDPPLVPAPCFPPMSLSSNNHSPSQFFDEATYTEKLKTEAMYTQIVNKSEELPDMESENSDELDPTHTPVDENPNLNQGHQNLTADFVLDAHPSEKKLIESYLRPHVVSGDKLGSFIHDGDVYAAHPANLTREYAATVSSNGHQVWYFFTTMRARGGRRKARTVDSGEGSWHSEGKPKPVDTADQQVGYRRYLTFVTKDGSGRVRSKWVMVELSLHDDGKDEVTLCKVYFSRYPAKNHKGKAAADTNHPGDASADAGEPAK